ncbi:MAG: glycosyltransferase [Bacteroidales bacterium]
MIVFQTIVGVLLIIYLVIMWCYFWALRNYKKPNGSENNLLISVVVAARNEEKHLPNLLSVLYNQYKRNSCFELTVVDDCSDDSSLSLLEDFRTSHKEFPLTIVSLKEQSGKKTALSKGVAQAKGDILAFTDADCLPADMWIDSIQRIFGNKDIHLFLGSVAYKADHSLFQRLQSLEFNSLQAATAGACAVKSPIMCNGANLVVRASVYKSVKEKMQGEKYASGDDVFLLHTIKKEYSPDSIVYMADKSVTVYTHPSPDLHSFFHQRSRWAGKSTGYTDPATIGIALIVFAVNLCLSVFFFGSLVSLDFLLAFVFVFVFKSFSDLPLMYQYHKIKDELPLIRYFFFLQLIYPLYIVSTATYGMLFGGKWKGLRRK